MSVGDEDWFDGVMPDWRARAHEAMKDAMNGGRIHIDANPRSSDPWSRFTYGGGSGGGKSAAREHDGGKALTQEDVLRRRMVARRLVLTDAEYAASGVEVIPGTCQWRVSHHAGPTRRF